jgi:tRNA threonylcarbamoyl adenosine modification protein YjeE
LRYSPNVELRRPLRTFIYNVPDPEAMRSLGESLAGQLRAGDLVVLSGELGAGKTTFTQGIGAGLQVRGDVTSPTFVISREHPPLDGGPPLVHVDAYRLGGIDELDDLDLDTSLDDAVTIVEWGEGLAEGLAESRLEVRIFRALAHQDEHADLDPRRVLMTPIGPRWYQMEVPNQRAPLAEKLNENLLVDFRHGPESELDSLDPAVPLKLAVMVAEHDGRVVLVHNGWRQEWELPVGDIRDDEQARDTAMRRFAEETGTSVTNIEFVGVGTVQLGHERSIEYIAVFRTDLARLAQFEASDEVDKLAWWDTVRDFDGLSPIDEHLARLAIGAGQ